jgi:Cupin-like domain
MSKEQFDFTGARLMDVDAGEFRKNFNEKSFMFRHNMASHPLFELPRIALAAERMLARGDLEKFVALGGQTKSAGTKFSAMPARERLATTITQLAEAGAWLKVSSVDTADPDYAELLQRVLFEFEELANFPLRREITWTSLTLFLASPHVVTPYHIDHESNFLFQVSGEKDITLFDPRDRGLLSEPEIERFYAGDYQAAQYREENQPKGSTYRLEPGRVVHHPPLAPHWIRNGDNVSISVSIGFCMRDIDRRARVYQVNHFLRRFGVPPTAPGRSKVSDGIKIAGIGMISKSNPTTPAEILFSGMSRLAAPPRMLKRLVRRVVGPAS